MEATQPFKQKCYDVMLAVTRTPGGIPMHTVPMSGITRDELKYLAFVHGGDSIVQTSIKFVGEKVVEMAVRADAGPKEGQEILVPVTSQMQEFVRIAKKYDMTSELIGLGKSRQRVEECFKVRLDDFDDSILAVADPLSVAEEMAARAELAALEEATRPTAKAA